MARPAWVSRMKTRQLTRAEREAQHAEIAKRYFALRAHMQGVKGEIPFPMAAELPVKRNLVLSDEHPIPQFSKTYCGSL
jgi:hypothetical protein